jgi:hypothetical protein
MARVCEEHSAVVGMSYLYERNGMLLQEKRHIAKTVIIA